MTSDIRSSSSSSSGSGGHGAAPSITESPAPPAQPRPISVGEALSAARRTAAERSLRVFAETYLPHHFPLKPSAMHLELFDLLEDASRRRGARIALAAPRGHAKSTLVSVAYALWSVCYAREEFIVLISDCSDQAIDHLATIRRELEDNQRLIEDFPGVCEAPDQRPSAPRWKRADLITRSGIRIAAFGAGQKLRGRKHQKSRPTLIICDDLENEADVRSEDQRKHLFEWFTRTLTKAGTSGTNIVVVGTILHYGSLLAQLVLPGKSPGWTGRKHQAVKSWSKRPDLWEKWEAIFTLRDAYKGERGPDAAEAYRQRHRTEMLDGTEVAWPEREDYTELMRIRVRDGRASFDCEKQNDPINPDDCLFSDSDFHYWDDEYESAAELIRAIGEDGLFYGALDPSLGKEGRGRDDSAIVTLLKDESTGICYVVDADVRRRKPSVQIQNVIDLHALRQFEAFGVEANQFQQFLADEVERRSNEAKVYVPVVDITQTRDKIGRIQRLQPLISSGRLRFSRRHTTLMEQLRQFPMAAHDDGPDALELAWQTIDNSVPALVTGEMADRYERTGRWYDPEEQAQLRRELAEEARRDREEMEAEERYYDDIEEDDEEDEEEEADEEAEEEEGDDGEDEPYFF